MTGPLVFVVDDDLSARRGIGRLLEATGYRVEAFASPAEFFERPPHGGPSCLVLDLEMPGMSGLDLQARLHESGHELPIVFVTGHGDVPSSVQAMKGGAIDFLLKPFEAEDLVRAVEVALERGRDEAVEREDLAALRERWSRLTQREREVGSLVVAGFLNKQVAGRLGISEKTVKVHRARVMEKTGTTSLAELVRLAQRLEAAGALPEPLPPEAPGTKVQ